MDQKIEKRADEFIKEYLEKWKSIYRDFSFSVELILKTLLESSSVQKYQTSCREKNYKKLKKKIIQNKYSKLEQVKDLAGCRVLFYVQEDIELFKKYLWDEFKVESVKLHYPFSNESKNKVYYGEHFYIKLKENRLSMPEYAKFKNLRCEIQLTTILYHSSSELEHDISYNPPEEIGSFYKEEVGVLKNRFEDVLKKYIRPAQNEFDEIWRKFNSISEGNRMFGYAFTQNILNPKSINDLYSDLSFLKSKVELFKGKLPDNIDLFKIIRSSLEKSKAFKTENINTSFGKLKGHSYDDILSLCLEIINYLKFLYPEDFFDLLVEIFEQQNINKRKGIIEIISSFTKNDYNILQKIGYKPKEFVLDRIESWNEEILIKRMEIILAISKNLLNPSFEGTSMKDYKTMVFSSGPLKATTELTNIRERTIKLLMKLYSYAKNISQKKEILSAMEIATQTPRQGVYGDDMENMVQNNAESIVNYFEKILSKSDNEIISEIEKQVSWLYKRFGDNKIPKLKKLREKINKNVEYKIYRVFVGYEDRFSEKLSWEECRKVRTEKVQEFVMDINEVNFEVWKNRIFHIFKNFKNSDSSGYQYFNIFLNELAKHKPSFAFRILEKNNRIPFPFLVSLMSGILNSSSKIQGIGIMKEWIKRGNYLDVCANIFSYDVEIEEELVLMLFQKSKTEKNVSALNGIIRVLANNYPKYNNKELFLNTIKELTILKSYFWINDVWHQKDSILNSLEEKDFEIILNNLIIAPRVDYHIEEILSFFAKTAPKKIINFFYDRIQIKKKKKLDTAYDSIPYDLHILGEVLSKDKNADVVISQILKWFGEKDWLYSWDAGNLFGIIFPQFDNKLESKLFNLIDKGGESNAKIVTSILDKYEGQVFLHKVCQKFVKKYPLTKEYKGEIFHVLSKTGLVMGEYGFVEAYKKKRGEIQSWKTEKSKKIQSFVKEYEIYLDKQIEYEQKRADEQVELMKRRFE